MVKGQVFIGTPTYRREVVNDYVISLARDTRISALNGWFIDVPYFQEDTLIHWAREKLIKAFLATEHDYIVLIDSDLGWEEGGLLKLLEVPPEADIVGALYRAKCDNVYYPVRTYDNYVYDGTVWFPAMGVPAGFLRISRKAVHRMFAEHAHPFHFMENDHGAYFGEDFAFCERARKLGLHVMARADIEFTHVGPYQWAGRYVEDMKEPNDGK